MTSQLSTHFEKLQLRHVHLGAGAAWQQISAWKCCTRWGLLKMMPYQSFWTDMLIIDDLILAGWHPVVFLRGGAIPKSTGFVCTSAHALYKLAHFGQPTLKSQESAEIKNSKTWRLVHGAAFKDLQIKSKQHTEKHVWFPHNREGPYIYICKYR